MTKTKLKTYEVKTYIINKLIRANIFKQCRDEMEAFDNAIMFLKKTWQGPLDGINFEIKEVLDSKK